MGSGLEREEERIFCGTRYPQVWGDKLVQQKGSGLEWGKSMDGSSASKLRAGFDDPSWPVFEHRANYLN